MQTRAPSHRRPRNVTARDRDYIAALADHRTMIDAARTMGVSVQHYKNVLAGLRRITGARSTYDLIYRLASGELDGEPRWSE
jgi:hypothetical protein